MTDKLITFFSEKSDDPKDRRLVGIGITDEVLEHLKSAGIILQEADRTGQGIDIVIVYAPNQAKLAGKISGILPGARTIIKVI